MAEFDKNTCWYMGNEIIAEMTKACEQSQPSFFQLDHIKALQKLIEHLPPNQFVVDLGCGTAQISQLFPAAYGHKYFGADLDFVLDGCARKLYPDNPYIVFDAEKSDYSFMNTADVVLMNGFIDVMEFPLQILEKVLMQDPDHILLHRQEFTKIGHSHTIKNKSYCGITYHSIISTKDFNDLLINYNYTVTHSLSCGFNNWESGGHTMLISKIQS